jgi:hypothetical protein
LIGRSKSELPLKERKVSAENLPGVALKVALEHLR